MAFKGKKDEKARNYIDRFEEIVSRMKNLGNMVPDVFLAVHFLERSVQPEMTKQNILSVLDLEDKNNIFKEVKKKYENLVSAVGEEDLERVFWGQAGRSDRKIVRMPRRPSPPTLRILAIRNVGKHLELICFGCRTSAQVMYTLINLTLSHSST